MSAIEQGWGLLVVLWFQAWRSPVVIAIAEFFHIAGGEDVALVILPMVYWCVDAAFGRRLTLFFLFNAWVNSTFKELLMRPRPYQVSADVKPVLTEASYGIPSGHAQNAVVLWGLIALHFKKNWLTWAVVAYAILTALSRLVLGVHFPQDVIGGLAAGLILLGLYVWLEPRVSTWIAGLSLAMQIGLAIVIGLVMLAIHPLLIPITSGPDNTVAASVIGAIMGGGTGIALERRYVRFDAKGDWWKRGVRLLIGMLGAVAIRFGLGAVFENLQPDLVFRVLRYALIGLWIGFGAPWVFVKTRLADKIS